MGVCGCGNQLAGASNGLIAAGGGITLSGSFQDPPTTITDNSALGWLPFTPDTLQFTLGNALNSSRYLQNDFIGDAGTIDVIYAFRFGNTSTWNASEFELGLPSHTLNNPVFSTSDLYALHQIFGHWTLFDSSANLWYEGRTFLGAPGGSHPVRMRWGDDIIGTNTSLRQGTPITIATNDELVVTLHCEVQ